MPTADDPGRRPGPRIGVAVAVAGLLLAGCAGGGDDAGSTGAGGIPEASATVGPPTAAPGADAAAVASAVDALLTSREAALAGDAPAGAYAETVADPGSAAGRRQLSALRAARDLRITHLTHDVVAPVADPAAVEVGIRYRVSGVDRADRRATVRYRLVESGAGWRVADEAATGADAAPPWLAMPDLVVRRTDHAVLAGTAGRSALDAAAATVERALPALARQWEGTPGRTLVLVPDTADEADALRGASGPVVGDVAASTDGPTDAAGLATGDRVVLDPDARRRLTPTGLDVVLTHELAHVAVRATVPGSPPTWLAEGHADHVGYARADLPQRTLARALVDAVRAGDAPTELPTADALDPAVSDIEVGYLAAWQAAETVVDVGGEDALRDLVRACASRDGPEAARTRCDAALPRVLGIDRADLTRRWQERLAGLAR